MVRSGATRSPCCTPCCSTSSITAVARCIRHGRRLPAEPASASAASAGGLVKLKAAGVLNWLRRCVEDWIDGRFTLRQETNAYAVLPCSQWRGYSAPPPAPPPDRGTWGDHPPLPSAIGQAVIVAREGGDLAARIAALESDGDDQLAIALARLGRLIGAGKP